MILIISMTVLLHCGFSTKKDMREDLVTVRVVHDGTNDLGQSRNVNDGYVTNDIKVFFKFNSELIDYSKDLVRDFPVNKPFDFILVYKTDTLIIEQAEKYVCRDHAFRIKVSYDLKNPNSSSYLISSNVRSCGDLYLILDNSELNKPYHLIQFENYEFKI